MLRAVGFDLWETLITETPELTRQTERLRLTRIEEILSARGLNAEAQRIEHAYRQMWHRCHELYWSVDRDIPCRTQIEHFLDELGLDEDTFALEALDELEDAYANASLDVLPNAVEGARNVVTALKSRGLKVGLISNTGRTPGSTLREVLNRLGIGNSIDAMVFSNEHGVCKPDPSIFDELRRALDVRYDEMLFVGDNLYVDVLGAKRCGMRAVHFAPPARGSAFAPHVEHDPVDPDATITRLEEVVGVVEGMMDLSSEL